MLKREKEKASGSSSLPILNPQYAVKVIEKQYPRGVRYSIVSNFD